MRLVKYESYIVTVKSASCLPAGEYLLYFQFYADDEIAIRKYE